MRSFAHLFALVLIVLSALPWPAHGVKFETHCTLQQSSLPQSERVATNLQKTLGKQAESDPQVFESLTTFLNPELFGPHKLTLPTLYLSIHLPLQERTDLCPRAPPV